MLTKKLIKNSLLYLIMGFSTKIFSFAFVFAYLSYLGPADFGLYDYLLAIGAIISVIFTLDISQSIYRFVPEHANKKEFISSLLCNSTILIVFTFIFLFLIVLLYGDFISRHVLENKSAPSIIVLAVSLFMLNALFYIQSSYYSASQKVVNNIVHQLSYQVIAGVLSVLFLHFFEAEVTSIIIAHIISLLIVISISGYYINSVTSYLKFSSFDFQILKFMLKFSIPLIPSSLGVIIMMFTDRIIVKEYLDFDAVGFYGLAMRFATIALIFISAIRTAITPMIYEHHNETSTAQKLNTIFVIYLFFALALTIFSFFYADQIILIIAGPSYGGASMLVSVLLLNTFINNGYIFFPGLYIKEKTAFISAINVCGMTLNVILNIIFIQKFGVVGVAYATLFCSSLIFITHMLASNRVFPMYSSLNLKFIIITIIFANFLLCYVNGIYR